MTERLIVCLLLTFVLCAVLTIESALADEFSNNVLGEAWTLDNASSLDTAVVSGGTLSLRPSCAAASYLTKAPLDGDWEINTQFLDVTGRSGDYFHGMLLYTDWDNYLVFGKTAGGVALRGEIGGVPTGDLLSCRDRNYLKIRKVTRNAQYATYYFYATSVAPNQYQWLYVGCYEDKSHAFDDLQYGFWACGDRQSTAVYDYFVESVLDYDFSTFADLELVDGIWQVNTDSVTGYVATNGSLLAAYKKSDLTPAILRDPIDQDWVLDTLLLRSGAGIHGLIVYSGEKQWLLLGGTGIYACRDGETFCIYEKPSSTGRLRIMKQGNTYTLFYSEDGVNYSAVFSYTDDIGALENARYGIGALDAAGSTASYQFVREMHTPNGMVAGVAEFETIGRLIGAKEDDALNDTYDAYRLRSGDLGSLLDAGDRVYMMLGDSFSGAGTGSGDWRCNVLATIEDNTPEDGLTIIGVECDENGIMRELITARHSDYDEITCIPNNGVLVDGVLYYQYMSVYHWGVAAHWDCNYAGWAYSADGGVTWSRLENFFDASSNFMICALLHTDGFVYLYGIPSGKFGSIKLARVPEDEILNKDAYSFFTGLDGQNEPIWSSLEADAVPIVEDQVSELSVIYDQELCRYLMIYMNEYTLNMVLRDAETIWGTWSNPVILTDHTAVGFRYAPFMLERYIADEGRLLYFIATDNTQYAVTWNKVRLLTRE